MSRHHFHTTHENRQVQVVIGWDRRLEGYFMTVERLDVDHISDEDIFLFNNLECTESHPASLDPFLKALEKLNISLPDKIYSEMEADKYNDVGNKLVEWRTRNGDLDREQTL